MASSLEPDVRRGCEDALITRYHRALVEGGVVEYTAAQCRADYGVSVLGRLFITAVATVKLDNTSDHRRAWRRADLTRLLAFVADHRVTADRVAAWVEG